MTTRSAFRSLSVAAVLTATLTVSGCGNDTEALCSAVDDLKASVADVTELQLDQDALGTLEDNLAEVRTDVDDVKDAAGDAYATELDEVDKAAASAGLAIDFAVSSPSPETLADVGPALQRLGTALADLVAAAKGDC